MFKFNLKGRNVYLRDLERADADEYLIFFNQLSDESIRCRFGHLLTRLTEPEAEARVNGNLDDEIALAIFEAESDRILAIGRCYFDVERSDAEVALVVSEDERRLGLGRILLKHLVQVAKNGNSSSIHAYVATRNAPIIVLLRSEGFKEPSLDNNGDLRLTMEISSD